MQPPDWTPPEAADWWSPRADQGLEGHFLEFLRWVMEFAEDRFRPALERLFRDAALAHQLDEWRAFFDVIIQDFSAAVDGWCEDYDNLYSSWLAIEGQEARDCAQANMLRYQLATLYDVTVIEALADRQVLPRYGFPIGLLRLRVVVPDKRRPDRVREEDQYRLERRGLLALREYVPGSQLLVGGKLVTSRGLMKHWTGANLDSSLGLRGSYTRCTNRHLYYEITGSTTLGNCPVCGDCPGQQFESLLLPRHGFTSAAWDPPRSSTDVESIGHVERATISFSRPGVAGAADLLEPNFGEIAGLRARYREDGELLVFNRGEEDCGFAICVKCGYAESERRPGTGRRARGQIDLPASFLNHPPLSASKPDHRCWAPREAVNPLRFQTLAASETTDVLLLDFSECLSVDQDHEALIETLARAFQISGARFLELDTRELGSMVVPAGPSEQALGVVLYDNVPGGAGHVRELLGLGRSWLRGTLDTLRVDREHHARCETACLDCLLTFDAQEVMSRGLLRRRLAYETLSRLIGLNDEPRW